MQHFTTHDAKARFAQMLDAVGDEPVTIERNGLPIAVLMPKEDFDELDALRLEHLRTAVQKGIAACERGDCTELDEGELADFANRIKSAGRGRVAG